MQFHEGFVDVQVDFLFEVTSEKRRPVFRSTARVLFTCAA